MFDMSFGGEDKIVSVRFNPQEKRELDYVVKNYGRNYQLPVGNVIKDLVHKAYNDMKAKDAKK